MHRSVSGLLFALTIVSVPITGIGAQEYVPPRGDWAHRRPAEVGMDSVRLAAAAAFAQAHENGFKRDMHAQVAENVAREPYPDIVGPIRDRGGPAGVIVRHGYLVATWGDVERVDMTFSVSKSYLSTIAALALADGLIRDVHDRVADYVHDGGFEGPHNGAITWEMLLNQTNEWEGTLWDKPDVADRRRGYDRTLETPGTFWEYNDVRVNRTALSLLEVWKRPLPVVLRERIMDPIGASPTWEWHGYRNSWITIDGRDMLSVSGGGHWGGGVWASTLDHARYGLLFLRRGRWGTRQLFPASWIDQAMKPTPIMPTYGFMWWLNPEGKLYPSAPAEDFFARGSGGNIIWVDPKHDLVAVMRWMDTRQIDEFIKLTLAAVIE
jgi:CubicO group peptidase (beta-lactamase class C family)